MEGKMSVTGVNPPEYRVQRSVHYRVHILFAFKSTFVPGTPEFQ